MNENGSPLEPNALGDPTAVPPGASRGTSRTGGSSGERSKGGIGGDFGDSFGRVTLSSSPCPVCGAAIAVSDGACLKCELGTALDAGDGVEDASEESLEALLAGIDVTDTDWQLGNYHILEEIGRGGMGVIYRARQRHSKRIVALKRVLSYHGDSRETLERFRREAEAAASLDHPNVLPIYEVGEADGLPFFTMKLATGGSLQRTAAGMSAEPRECVRLLAKVARAIAYAHRQGILHRDLKPGNILLDAVGEPLVTDFGLAKWMDARTDLTRSLAIFGTPGFIAPEQARGPAGALTPAADVYSLGAILFDLLTGRAPFLGEHAMSVIQQAGEKPAPKLRSLKPSLDRDLETICAKCLEREPQARYRSAADLAEDLERWLEGRPIIARPVSPPAKLWRWSKRNPLLAGTAAVCLLIGAIAVTRQIDSWRLQKQVVGQIAAQHSIEVLPLLDLDLAGTTSEWTQRLAVQLERDLKAIGPAALRINSNLANASNAATRTPGTAPARAILTGTTRAVNGKRRLSLHVLDASSHTPLWHQMYEDDPGSVVRLAALVAGRDIYEILSAAELQSASRQISDPGLVDPEAKRFIEQGIELAERRAGLDLDRSIACLRHAIELQRMSSAAWAALAKSLVYKAAYGSDREPLPEALTCAQRAIALNSANSEAHITIAGVLFETGKTAAAIEEATIALEFAPHSRRAAHLLGNIYKELGRPDKALVWFDIGRLPGKETASSQPWIADCLAYLGEDARAETIYERYLKLHPEQPEGWMGICRLRLLNGRIDEARTLYRREMQGYTSFAYAAQMAAQVEFFGRDFSEAEKLYTRLFQEQPAGGSAFYGNVSYASALGRIKVQSDPTASRQLLATALQKERQVADDAVDRPAPFYRVAAIEASLGYRDEAVESLRRAVERGWIDFRSLEMDPRFDAIRGLPTYGVLRDEMKQRVESLRANVPVDFPDKSKQQKE